MKRPIHPFTYNLKSTNSPNKSLVMKAVESGILDVNIIGKDMHIIKATNAILAIHLIIIYLTCLSRTVNLKFKV